MSDNIIILNPGYDPEHTVMMVPEGAIETVCLHLMDEGDITIETSADWYEARSMLWEALDHINEHIEILEEQE